MKKNRKKYLPEFKEEAVKLITEQGVIMKPIRSFFILVTIISCILLCSSTASATPAPSEPDQELSKLDNEQINSILNELIDAKIKKAVSEIPEAGTHRDDKIIHRPAIQTLINTSKDISAIVEKLGFLVSGIEESSGSLSRIMDKITDSRGLPVIVQLIAGLFGIILFGAFVEWLVRKAFADLNQKIITIEPENTVQKVRRVILRFFIETICAGSYILSSFILFSVTFKLDKPMSAFVACYLITSYYIRTIALIIKITLSPAVSHLRPFKLDDENTAIIARWIMRIAGTGTVLGLTAIMIKVLDTGNHFYMLSCTVAGITVLSMVTIMIMQNRKRVSLALSRTYLPDPDKSNPIQEKLVEAWYIPAILYTLTIGIFLQIGILVEAHGLVNRLLISFICLPAWMLLDQIGQRLLNTSFQTHIIPLDSDEPEPPKETDGDFTPMTYIEKNLPIVRRVLRILLVSLVFLMMMKVWGIDWRFARAFTRGGLGIIITILVGYLAWEFTRSYIDRKIKEEMPEEDEEMEEGGSGGSRLGTLLLLLRKFIMVVFFVMVSMIVLSAIGIDIGPLIAGAGIFGLAIGFGAQTLVKDIFSGIFFLVDDAFRLGDYVDTGKVKGTVEHISIRSLRLRHHRGMVHTIPFGSLGSVTNFSRDYIIMKLRFRVKYDTDVDKVRKIIKKINKNISKDEEMNASLLSKIKSQGVKALDDSAMIMAVKFKTVPGEQFLVRREVFKMMQEEFKNNGIEFAHRNVTVYLPPENSENTEKHAEKQDELLRQRAGAAGAAAILAEEERLLQEQESSK